MVELWGSTRKLASTCGEAQHGQGLPMAAWPRAPRSCHGGGLKPGCSGSGGPWKKGAEATALQGEDDAVAGWGGGRGTARHHGGRELGRPGCTSNERISKIKMQRCAQEVLAIPLDQSRCHLSGLVGKTTQRCHHHS